MNGYNAMALCLYMMNWSVANNRSIYILKKKKKKSNLKDLEGYEKSRTLKEKKREINTMASKKWHGRLSSSITLTYVLVFVLTIHLVEIVISDKLTHTALVHAKPNQPYKIHIIKRELAIIVSRNKVMYYVYIHHRHVDIPLPR